MKNGLLASALLLLFQAPLMAQEPVPMERTDFSIRNGMPSNEVNDICQDHFGFLWVATGNGLSRFDGYDFLNIRSSETVRLGGNRITAIETAGRQLCCLTSLGIDLVDVSDLSVVNIRDSILRDARIRTIVFRDQERILMGGRGIFEYDIRSGTSSKMAQMQVRTLYCDTAGNVWIGTWGNGIFWIPTRSGTLEKFYLEGVPDKLKINSFSETPEGDILVGTWGDGLFCLHGTDMPQASVSHLAMPVGAPHSLDWNIIYQVVSDKKGRIFAGTPGGLLETRSPLTHATCHQDAIKEIKGLFCDREGNVWMSNPGRGMSMLSYSQDAVREISLPGHTGITAVYEAPGDIYWLGVQGLGVARYDAARDSFLEDDPILKDVNASTSNAAVAFAANPKNASLLMATRYDGVYEVMLKGERAVGLKHYNTADCKGVNKYTDALFRDSENRFWVGTHSGIAVIADGILSQPQSLNEAIGYAHVTAICQHEGAGMFIGTADRGIFRSTEAGVQSYSMESGGLSTDNILCLFRDSSGRLWTGTSAGLYEFNEQADRFISSPASVNLLSDEVVSITEDGDGTLWLATGNGFASLDPVEGKLSTFGFLPSLKNLSFFPGAACAHKRRVAFGGYNALTIFYTDELMSLKHISRPIITLVASSGSVLSMNPEIENVTLRHNEGNISISFASPSFASASFIKYSYRMTGQDKGWQYTVPTGRTVNYMNLKHGHYKFEVRASDFSGSWSEPATLSITVPVAPYLSGWAFLAYFAAIALAVFATLSLRRKLRSHKKDLEERTSQIEHLKRQTIDLDAIKNVKTPNDRAFLEKIVGLVEQHLDDPAFNIEAFYAEMNMSSSSSYRKIKMLTGMSPKEFVRDIRMKYACKMLEEKTANVADVAYAVGYSDAKYFSVCFKKVVGVTPSRYMHERFLSSN